MTDQEDTAQEEAARAKEGYAHERAFTQAALTCAFCGRAGPDDTFDYGYQEKPVCKDIKACIGRAPKEDFPDDNRYDEVDYGKARRHG